LADPFESPKLLLARAKENAADFWGRVEAYSKANPWAVVTDPEPETGKQIVKARLTKALPSDARAVFSDAVNNLRHALDQSVNSAAVEIRGGQLNCYFPFGTDAVDFALIYGSKRYKTIPIEIRPYLNSLQPYAGGDDLLHALNRISGPNKHQALLTIELAVDGFGGDMTASGSVALGIGPWDSAKNELPIARVGAGTQLNMNFQVVANVTLGGRHAMSGQPALGVLDAFSSKAESIISGIEAETARILRERGG
jgi:hypothetical protein